MIASVICCVVFSSTLSQHTCVHIPYQVLEIFFRFSLTVTTYRQYSDISLSQARGSGLFVPLTCWCRSRWNRVWGNSVTSFPSGVYAVGMLNR